MASQGPNSPSTGADDAGTGTIAWSNPTRITLEDGTLFAQSGAPGGNTHYLVASGFGFTVPDDATIDGVLFEIKRKGNAATGCTDNKVHMVIGGSVVTTQNKAQAGEWGTTFAYASYGGAADLWGETVTPAIVNAANFGVAVSAAEPTTTRGQVDYVRATVYYTEASSAASYSVGSMMGVG